MYMLVDLWFLFPNLCVSQLYVSSIVGAACGGLNEPEAWKLHVLGLCLGVCTFTCTLPAFVLSKILKNATREKAGKSPRTPQESPGTPVNFFRPESLRGSKGFFPFRTSVSVKWPWRRERPLRLCLWALQLRGRRPQLKHLQKPLVCPKERKIEPRALKPTLVTQKNLRYVRSFVLKKG